MQSLLDEDDDDDDDDEVRMTVVEGDEVSSLQLKSILVLTSVSTGPT